MYLNGLKLMARGGSAKQLLFGQAIAIPEVSAPRNCRAEEWDRKPGEQRFLSTARFNRWDCLFRAEPTWIHIYILLPGRHTSACFLPARKLLEKSNSNPAFGRLIY